MQVFLNYAQSLVVEVLDSKDPVIQLNITNIHAKNRLKICYFNKIL